MFIVELLINSVIMKPMISRIKKTSSKGMLRSVDVLLLDYTVACWKSMQAH
jgi:hypothetical protein